MPEFQWIFLKKSIISRFFLGFAILSFAPSIFAVGAGITYHGRLIDPNGNPVVGNSVQFKIQLRTPGNENCLMYEEVQVKDLSQSQGIFSITINDGSGSRLDTTGLSLDQVFANRGSFSFANGTCSVGTVYNTSPSDGRRIQVSFNDGSLSSGTWEPAPSMPVNFVPMSLEAMQVGGYKKEKLLRIANGVDDTQTELNTAAWTELLALVNGTSTQFVKSGSATFTAAPQWSGTPSAANDLVNKTYVDAQVAAGLPNIGTAGTYYKVTTDAKGRVTSGAASLAEADIPALSTAGKVSGGAINSGVIAGATSINSSGNLVTSGTVQGSVVSATNLQIFNNGKYVQLSAPAVAANLNFILPLTDGANGTLMKTNGSGQLSFAALSSSDIPSLDTGKLNSGTLPVTRGGTGAASFGNNSVILSNPTGTAFSSLNCTLGQIIKFDVSGNAGCATDDIGSGSQWTTNGSDIYYSTGNVGIGTSSPDSNLSVSANTAALQAPGTSFAGTVAHFGGANAAKARILIDAYGISNSIFPAISLRGARGTAASPIAVQGSDSLGYVSAAGYGATSYGTGGYLLFTAGESWTDSAHGTDFSLSTTPNGSTTNVVRMTVLNSGNVGLGTSSPTSSLHIVGQNAAGTPQPLLTIAGGNSTASGNGADISMNAGGVTAGAGTGGNVNITAGTSTNGGGAINLTAGFSGGVGSGGKLQLVGEAFAGGAGTSALLGGNGANGYGGGSVSVTGGTGDTAGNAKGGDAIINGGAKSGAGADGNVFLANLRGKVGIGTNAPNALLDVNGTMRVSQICDSAGANCKTVSGGWSAAAGLSALTAATGTGTIDNTNFAQAWNWSTATTETPMAMTANALTTGTLLNLTSSSASLNSTSGLLNVANTSASTTGTIARIQSNSTSGSGLTVLANGNVGIGTTSPARLFDIQASGLPSARFSVDLQAGPVTTVRSYGGNAGVIYATDQANDSQRTFIYDGGGGGISRIGSTRSRLGFLVGQAETAGAGLDQVSLLSSGNLGIGTITPIYPLQVAKTITATTGLNYVSTGEATASPSGSTTATVAGVFGSTSQTGNNSGGSAWGIYGYARRDGSGSGTANEIVGVNGYAVHQSNSPVTPTVIGVRGEAAATSALGTNQITNAYGGYFSTTTASPLYTANAYGIFTGPIQGNNKFSIYASDATAPSYFAGNVGIGTSSPLGTLTVQDGSGSSILRVNNPSSAKILEISTATNNGVLKLFDSSTIERVSLHSWQSEGPFLFLDSSTRNKPDGVTSGYGAGIQIRVPNVVGQENGIVFSNGAGYSEAVGAAINHYITDTGAYGRGGLKFKTTDSGSLTTRMTIDSTGNVGIGTTGPTEMLHVVGNLRVQGSTDCTLGNGSGGTSCSSDIRLKDHVREIDNSLEKILSLRGVEFAWNEKSRSPGQKAIGVIAQDVEKVFPTAVVEDPATGFKKVDYAVLVAPIIQALKSLVEKTNEILRLSDTHKRELSRELASVQEENNQLKQNQKIQEQKMKTLEERLLRLEATLNKN